MFVQTLFSRKKSSYAEGPNLCRKPTIRVDNSEVHDNNDNIVKEHFMVDVDGNIIGKYLFIVIWNICGEYLYRIFGRNISKEYLWGIFVCNYHYQYF